jgi:hypothetical protein
MQHKEEHLFRFVYEVEQTLERLLGRDPCSWDYLSDSEKLFWELAVEEVTRRPNMTARESYEGKRSLNYLIKADEGQDWNQLSSGQRDREELFLAAVKAALSLNQESRNG